VNCNNEVPGLLHLVRSIAHEDVVFYNYFEA
jgi:hypothetical protein